MRVGAYPAVLHNTPVTEAFAVLRELGQTGAEINSGGFLPAPHLPITDIRAGRAAREECLGRFAEYGVTLTALNCNGDPLRPDPEVPVKHGQDVRDGSLPRNAGFKHALPNVLRHEGASHSAPTDSTASTIEKA
ncbi:hypothetical protein [Streptomyces sp. GESEQ-35]|uniref:hypothetical protein n=1 Tax=Streptomyces sp. GESEQ-35 TaxID=2812657 RepID=UPI001B31F00E|nr:hypothetical protein [Streptomyces sp. GESEQ-35]